MEMMTRRSFLKITGAIPASALFRSLPGLCAAAGVEAGCGCSGCTERLRCGR